MQSKTNKQLACRAKPIDKWRAKQNQQPTHANNDKCDANQSQSHGKCTIQNNQLSAGRKCRSQHTSRNAKAIPWSLVHTTTQELMEMRGGRQWTTGHARCMHAAMQSCRDMCRAPHTKAATWEKTTTTSLTCSATSTHHGHNNSGIQKRVMCSGLPPYR